MTTRNLKDYLVAEAGARKGVEIDIRDISGMTPSKQIPQQDNFCDCGVFLLGYMRKFLEDPRGLATRLMQRDVDPDRDWPDMNPSKMRREIKELLMDMGRKQDAERAQEAQLLAAKREVMRRRRAERHGTDET